MWDLIKIKNQEFQQLLETCELYFASKMHLLEMFSKINYHAKHLYLTMPTCTRALTRTGVFGTLVLPPTDTPRCTKSLSILFSLFPGLDPFLDDALVTGSSTSIVSDSSSSKLVADLSRPFLPTCLSNSMVGGALPTAGGALNAGMTSASGVSLTSITSLPREVPSIEAVTVSGSVLGFAGVVEDDPLLRLVVANGDAEW